MQSLREQQIAAGATLKPDSGLELPLTFSNDAAAREASQTGIALYDRSHWGKIRVSGADRIRFLHNQSTNHFNLLKSGQGCDTVFVTSTARTVDLVTAYLLDESVLLLTSPGYGQTLVEWMDRFIFFADKVELQDITPRMAAFSVLGATSHALIEQLGAGALIDQPDASHQTVTLKAGMLKTGMLNDAEVRVAVGSGLATPGYTVLAEVEQAAAVWQALVDAGAVPMGEQLWQQLRVEQGRPMPGHELTDDYNPLEAGLWQTISLSKGCYIGQETIARLHTYKGVKQQLWGVRLARFAAPESIITVGEEKIGRLTSCVSTDTGYMGLAYIRTKAVAPGLQVKVGELENGELENGELTSGAQIDGELVALPFVSHEYI